MKQKDPLSILIVDDNPVDRMLYRSILSKSSSPSFVFFEAEQGEQGLLLYSQKQPDCILLDFELPDCNGFEFLEQLRIAHPKESTFPVIVLSGHEDEELAKQMIHHGSQAYIKKGELDVDALLKTILYTSNKHEYTA